MKRKNFLKSISLFSLSPLLFPKLLKAGIKPSIQTSNYAITDVCVGCGACVYESEHELIIEIDGDDGEDYIFNPDPDSSCINFVWDDGKKANIGGSENCYYDIENLMDTCPVDAIVEI